MVIWSAMFEKTCAATKKVVTFLNFEKKNVKTYVQFHRPLNHSAFSNQLPKVGIGKSPTLNILLRNVDTRNYAT